MPTDENTQAVQQNWNPMWDPSTSSSSSNSDDFDFNFDSDLGTSSIWWDNIGQGASQGRTWMFLTPDEEAEKEELQNSWQAVSNWQDVNIAGNPDLWQDTSTYFPNVNVNNNVETVENSVENISFDQDENSQNDKFDDKIEDMISFDDDPSSSEDNSLNSSNENNSMSSEEDLASFDVNNPISSNDTDKLVSSDADQLSVNVNGFVPVNWDNLVETVIPDNLWWDSLQDQQSDANENVVQNDDFNEQNTQDVSGSDSTNMLEWTNDSQNDDWLQQEDKKVEETFGGENVENNQNMEINESPADVAQNVENMLNNTASDSENNFWQNNIAVNDNTWNSDTSLPDWLWQQVDSQVVEPKYVPNEADFSAMSNLLNSSTTWQVDFSNVDNQPETTTNFGVDLGWINDTLVSDPVQNQWSEAEVNTVDPLETMTNTVENTADIVNSVEDNVSTVDVNSIEPETMQTSIGDNQTSIWYNSQENVVDNNVVWNQFVQMDTQTQESPINNGINLDNIWDLRWSDLWNSDVNTWTIDNNVWTVPLNTMIDQEIQDMHVQPQNTSNIDQVQPQVQSQNVQVPNVKRKKQSWFKVIWIFLWTFLVLWVLVYGVSVMFPDKFKIFKKDVVVEYLTWNENNVGTEDNGQVVENPDNQIEDLENNGNIEQSGEWTVENGLESENIDGDWENNDGTNEIWEDLDPNSLAGLLLSDGTWSETNVVNVENTWDNWLIPEGIPSSSNNWTGEEFDPFSQIDGVLTEEKSDSDKLNEYIVQWTYYKELWISKNDKKMERYGDYIIFTATEELSKLEKWGEIDNSVFGRLDSTLQTLQE